MKAVTTDAGSLACHSINFCVRKVLAEVPDRPGACAHNTIGAMDHHNQDTFVSDTLPIDPYQSGLKENKDWTFDAALLTLLLPFCGQEALFTLNEGASCPSLIYLAHNRAFLHHFS